MIKSSGVQFPSTLHILPLAITIATPEDFQRSPEIFAHIISSKTITSLLLLIDNSEAFDTKKLFAKINLDTPSDLLEIEISAGGSYFLQLSTGSCLTRSDTLNDFRLNGDINEVVNEYISAYKDYPHCNVIVLAGASDYVNAAVLEDQEHVNLAVECLGEARNLDNRESHYMLPADLTHWVTSGMSNKAQVTRSLAKIKLGRLYSYAEFIGKLGELVNCDFFSYTPNVITEAIEQRVLLRKSADLEDYVSLCLNDDHEMYALYDQIFAQESGFPQPDEAMKYAIQRLLPVLYNELKHGQHLRIWIPGCGTGEAAYMIATLIQECCSQYDIIQNVKIYATDIHRRSLETASAGCYDKAKMVGMPDVWLDRFWEAGKNSYKIRRQVRNMIVFSSQDILKDPPFSGVHLMFCIDLLTRYKEAFKRQAMQTIGYAIGEGGYFLSGSNEHYNASEVGLFQFSSEFPQILRKKRSGGVSTVLNSGGMSSIQIKRFAPSVSSLMRFHRKKSQYERYQSVIDQLLEKYVPSAVIADSEQQIVHTIGDVKRFLPQFGRSQFTRDLLELVPADMRIVISAGITEVELSDDDYIASNLTMHSENKKIVFDLHVLKIKEDVSASVYYVFLFQEVSENEGTCETIDGGSLEIFKQYIEHLESELEASLLQQESLESSLVQENKMLVDSLDQVRSKNRELSIVSENTNTQLAEARATLSNYSTKLNISNIVMDALEEAIIVLDAEKTIVHFNQAACEYFPLVPADIGRKLDDLICNYELDLNQLCENLVLASGQSVECFLERQSTCWQLSNVEHGYLLLRIKKKN